MRERAIGSIGVVVVGLVPALLGGPVFALALTALLLVGYSEFVRLSGHLDAQPMSLGYGAILLFGTAALLGGRNDALLAATATAVGLPLIVVVFGNARSTAAVQDWAFTVAGILYLGLPLFAGVTLRRQSGSVDAAWLAELSGAISPGWADAPRGLGWLLIVILATWFGDTAAYLVGRSFGRRPLLPRVSPKKTVEGSIGGLGGSAIAGAAGVALFGLGVPVLVGGLVGLILGAAGQVGDLAESFLKRQAGIKDSGTLIRGHGGMLDRIDALLFTLVAGYLLVLFVERWI